MANCNNGPLVGISTCDNNAGGIKRVMISPSEYVTGYTTTSGEVTAISMSGGTPQFVSFEFNKNSASFNEVETISLENGSQYFLQEVSIKLPKRELAKRNALALVSAGLRNLVIVFEDFNGIFWYVGAENFANLTENISNSGTAKGDGSSYQLKFTAEEPVAAYTVDSAIIAALLA